MVHMPWLTMGSAAGITRPLYEKDSNEAADLNVAVPGKFFLQIHVSTSFFHVSRYP